MVLTVTDADAVIQQFYPGELGGMSMAITPSWLLTLIDRRIGTR